MNYRNIIWFIMILSGSGLLAGCACPSPATAPFNPALGVCTSFENGHRLKACNYSYIEESVGRFLMPTKPAAIFHKKLLKYQIIGFPVYACNGFLPGRLKAVGPKPKHGEILAYAERACKRAQQAGVKTIVFGSSGARRIPKGFDRGRAKAQFVELLQQMGPMAAKYDIVISIEPLNRGEVNFINSLAEGLEIVRLVDHPNIRLLADFYHMAKEGEGPEEVVKAGGYLYHCHIAEKKNRAWPGKTGFDFTGYFRALRKINYQGRISVECRWRDFKGEVPRANKYLQDQIIRSRQDQP